MSDSTTTVNVAIPDASASRSKMGKKGWKCWAKQLTAVDTPANNGYAYHGEFVPIGTTMELTPGDVILHVDQSNTADMGVVLVNAAHKGVIKWLASADSDGRRWCAPLAKTARNLLGMTTDERIRHVAAIIAAEESPDRPASVQAYWAALADPPAPEADPEPDESPAADALSVMPFPPIAVLADSLRGAIASRRDRLEGLQRRQHDPARQAEIDMLARDYDAVYALALRAGIDALPATDIATAAGHLADSFAQTAGRSTD
jgi:hypothetical protein